jgi:hypothetical protein
VHVCLLLLIVLLLLVLLLVIGFAIEVKFEELLQERHCVFRLLLTVSLVLLLVSARDYVQQLVSLLKALLPPTISGRALSRLLVMGDQRYILHIFSLLKEI